MGSTTTLAATAYDWVGGNFAGLLALQNQCAQVASTITSADNALSRQVSAVAGAGNWSGAADGRPTTTPPRPARKRRRLVVRALIGRPPGSSVDW
jgi:hypothetical protein